MSSGPCAPCSCAAQRPWPRTRLLSGPACCPAPACCDRASRTLLHTQPRRSEPAHDPSTRLRCLCPGPLLLPSALLPASHPPRLPLTLSPTGRRAPAQAAPSSVLPGAAHTPCHTCSTPLRHCPCSLPRRAAGVHHYTPGLTVIACTLRLCYLRCMPATPEHAARVFRSPSLRLCSCASTLGPPGAGEEWGAGFRRSGAEHRMVAARGCHRGWNDGAEGPGRG